MEHLDYTCNKKNSDNHFVFKKADKEHINIPKHKSVKEHYVKKVLKTYKEDTDEKQRVLPKPTLPSNHRKR